MQLSTLDWTIVAFYFLFVLTVGLWFSKKAGSNITEYFLSGRNMPWFLLGISMVATTFSADTPNLVTDLVRQDGVSGNWGWWAFLLSGMLTVFVYAKLWRRSKVLTDIEFYELRYSGKAATFLRGFRALYLGFIFNVLVMGAVSLAAVKFGETILGWEGWKTLLIAGSITLLYTAFGGLKAIIVTDFVQFFLAIIGSIWACVYIVTTEVGGLDSLLSNVNVSDMTALVPDFSNPNVWIPVLIVPLAVQWWASYYPGAEPGGGGYIAQRMFSAKDEKNAIGATLLFNVAHYALRPWPWILIALASLVLFPKDIMKEDKIVLKAGGKEKLEEMVIPFAKKNITELVASHEYLISELEENNDMTLKENMDKKQAYLADVKLISENKNNLEIQSWAYLYLLKNSTKNKDGVLEFNDLDKRQDPIKSKELTRVFMYAPDISADKIGHDLGYPLMLTFLPSGLLGLVAASLIAAFMSTMSTQINLGASYLVNDFYQRFIQPDATQKQLITAARLFTIASAIFGLGLGLWLTSAAQAFNMLLLLGAGTGAIYLLRWFWWRINAMTEIVAMIASLIIAGFFTFGNHGFEGWQTVVIGAILTTIVWVVAAFITEPTDDETLRNFYKKIRPTGSGWNAVIEKANAEGVNIVKEKSQLPLEILCWVVGCVAVYAALFATGNWIYGNTSIAFFLTVISALGFAFLFRAWGSLKTD